MRLICQKAGPICVHLQASSTLQSLASQNEAGLQVAMATFDQSEFTLTEERER